MRTALSVGLALGLLTTARADDTARAAVKRAIDAQGGPAVLKALTAAHFRRVEWTLFVSQEGVKAPRGLGVQEEWFDPKGRTRMTQRTTSPPPEIAVTAVFDGKSLWIRVDEDLQEFSAEQLAWARKNAHHVRVRLLHGLLEDRAFGFRSLGESKVGGKAALGVAVSRKGHEDSLLYFDKASGVLVKHACPVLDSFDGGKKRNHELLLSDYQEVDFGAAHARVLKERGYGADTKSVLELLRRLTPPAGASKKAAALAARLGDDKFEEREKAAEGLVALGRAAVPALKAAGKSADPEVARRAARCLLRINPSREETTLRAAVRLLAARQADGACGPLLALLPDADDALNGEVCGALHALATKGGGSPAELVAALKDTDPVWRAAAEKALEKDGGEFARRAGRPVYPRGLKYAMKQAAYMGGAKLCEDEVKEVTVYNRLDDALFVKP